MAPAPEPQLLLMRWVARDETKVWCGPAIIDGDKALITIRSRPPLHPGMPVELEVGGSMVRAQVVPGDKATVTIKLPKRSAERRAAMRVKVDLRASVIVHPEPQANGMPTGPSEVALPATVVDLSVRGCRITTDEPRSSFRGDQRVVVDLRVIAVPGIIRSIGGRGAKTALGVLFTIGEGPEQRALAEAVAKLRADPSRWV
jgi:hypothetical protein